MINLFLIPIVLFVVCYAIGNWIDHVLLKTNDWKSKIIYGYIVGTGLFQILATIPMYLGAKFEILYWITVAITTVILVWNLLSWMKKEKIVPKFNKDRNEIFLLAIFILMVVFQVMFIVGFQHTDIDDSFYLAEINTILDSGKILANDPTTGIETFIPNNQYKLIGYEVLLSVITKLFHVNVAYLCHTIMPIVFIPLHYLVIYTIGKKLCEKLACVFSILYCLTNLFCGYSVYLQGTFLLQRVWQGKAVLVNVILPTLILIFISIINAKKVEKKQIILLSLILFSGIHASAVGLYFIPIAYFALTASFLCFTRSIKQTIKLVLPILFVLPAVCLKMFVIFDPLNTTNISTTVDLVTADSKALDFISEFTIKYLNQNYWILFLFLLSLLIIMLKGTKTQKAIYVLPTVILMLTFLNPYLTQMMARYVTGVPVYWRLFWLLNIPFVICISIIIVIELAKKKYQKVLLSLSGTIILIVSGTFLMKIDGENYQYAENKYKLNQKTVDIVDAVNQDSDYSNVSLLLPTELSYGVRQYCGNIEIPICRYTGESYLINGQEDKLVLLNSLSEELFMHKAINEEGIVETLKEFDINYLYLDNETVKNSQLPESFKTIIENDEYSVYRVEE